MTCINRVRVRKGQDRPGSWLEIEQWRKIAACVTGEMVDFSLFVCIVLHVFFFFFFYYREALTDLSSRKKEQVFRFWP